MKKIFVALLKFPILVYRLLISPLFPPVCRFYPTCSKYALQALDRYGPVRGTILAVKRVLKCNPYHPGGYDPLP